MVTESIALDIAKNACHSCCIDDAMRIKTVLPAMKDSCAGGINDHFLRRLNRRVDDGVDAAILMDEVVLKILPVSSDFS